MCPQLIKNPIQAFCVPWSLTLRVIIVTRRSFHANTRRILVTLSLKILTREKPDSTLKGIPVYLALVPQTLHHRHSTITPHADFVRDSGQRCPGPRTEMSGVSVGEYETLLTGPPRHPVRTTTPSNAIHPFTIITYPSLSTMHCNHSTLWRVCWCSGVVVL